jgi:hypothetical protein
MRNETDNKSMKLHGDYFTVQEMSSILGESTNTNKKRILRLGIKAIVRDALYTSNDFEKIKDVIMGRPKKAPEKITAKKPPEKTQAPDKKPSSKTKSKTAKKK